MIGHLQGEILFKSSPKIVIGTQAGVGYEVNAPVIEEIGENISLFISHIIRENSQVLFGFSTANDKELFELLLSVSGVGPKSAYSLVTNVGGVALTDAILFEDKKIIQSAPGIGPKAASQVILDLKDKIKKLQKTKPTAITVKSSSNDENSVNSESTNNTRFLREALMAFNELGYTDAQVLPHLQELRERSDSTEDLIKHTLQRLG